MVEQQLDSVNTKKLNLNITTPRGPKITENADMLIMRCIDGDLGVLPGHTPVSAILGDGILRIYNDGIEKKLALFGGVVEIDDTTVNIFSTIAQRPEEIDLERAERDRQDAEAAIMEESDELQFVGAHVLIRRSLIRIEVSQHLGEIDDYED